MFYEDRAHIIGTRIKANRKRLKLTQKELLERVYLSEKSVASLRKWENGERLPDLDTIARMAEVFNCDIGYLLGDYDESDFPTHKICERTGLSQIAVERLLRLHSAPHGSLGVYAKGYNVPNVGVLSNLIESNGYLELINEISLYLIYGGVLPQDAYTSDEKELSLQEYERFYKWANGNGREVVLRKDICEMHLQRASDELKNIFRDILKKDMAEREGENHG